MQRYLSYPTKKYFTIYEDIFGAKTPQFYYSTRQRNKDFVGHTHKNNWFYFLHF